jgi:hypothetical protein
LWPLQHIRLFGSLSVTRNEGLSAAFIEQEVFKATGCPAPPRNDAFFDVLWYGADIVPVLHDVPWRALLISMVA